MGSVTASKPSPTYSSFCMLELYDGENYVEYIFKANGKLFVISVHTTDLAGPGSLLEEFNSLRRDLDRFNKFEDWFLEPAEDFIRSVAPALKSRARQSTTLRDYYSCETFHLKLRNEAGQLHAIQQPYIEQGKESFIPRLKVIDNAQGVDFHWYDRHYRSIPRFSLAGVPRFLASEIERVDDDLRDWELDDRPRKVRQIGTDKVFYFKGAFYNRRCSREIKMLSQIEQNTKKLRATDPAYATAMRTSKLVGIVMWDDEETVMGLLLEYVEGQTLCQLLWEEEHNKHRIDPASKTKWAAQIESTLRYLHGIGIIWTGAWTSNVIITSGNDAVLVDFGGDSAPMYIPLEILHTVEGDFLGLKRIKEDLNLDLSDMPPSSKL
ncbi:hypothetical protein F5B22DRAFT_393709 [Xylaria bambusicola]|uniref:uncharacterized protein n=1 Tax=Xylaria bambusicola TaxID=326684 RepID=UPI002007FFDD|nr:uncharacterized protein F5B22DRAFT_393709 [Xylaria bambusicola]KAI0508606.1 hypothetical protein F5B22DRAFT_393709 [Xylaria bambusicola]